MGIPSQRAYDIEHLKRIEKYSSSVRSAYRKALKEICQLTFGLSLNKNDEFYFRNYSEVNKKVNDVLKAMYDSVYGTTVAGVKTEWDSAVDKNNALARYVFGVDLKDLPTNIRDKYFTNNAAARRAFLARKDGGLKLSQKVWNNTGQFKKELELALEIGIGKGKSAQSLAKDVQKSLNEPDRLYRRIREKPGGELRLSRAAKAYSPGQGRYRSSYKNALRLTRNEVNFSYEKSQFEKRQQQDFIVGIEIRVSPSHVPADDKGGISCLDLQGKYPKDFDFTNKWHVNCKCYTINILKTREELNEDVQLIISGKEPKKGSANQVPKLPTNYGSYISDNKSKWENWKNKPRTFTLNK